MSTLTDLYKIMNREDAYGNRIEMSKYGSLRLILASENRERGIGGLLITEDEPDIVYYVKNSKEKYIFKKLKAWGINAFVILNLKPTDKIIIKTNKKNYETTVKNVLEKGQYYFFKEQGFEKQIFLPLEEWT